MRARLESCMRTLIVSADSSQLLTESLFAQDIPKGWHTRASIMPAAPPAARTSQSTASEPRRLPDSSIDHLPIKLVAAEAGFLPPGPCVDFADMLCRYDVCFCAIARGPSWSSSYASSQTPRLFLGSKGPRRIDVKTANRSFGRARQREERTTSGRNENPP